MHIAELLVTCVAATAIIKGCSVLAQGIVEAIKPRPITVRRIGSSKSVTIPVQYNAQAIQDLIEILH